jgi:hypothetical protein
MRTQPALKVPASRESEMVVLGCMITTAEALRYSSEDLIETDFFFTEHISIFRKLKSLHKERKPADLHIVAESLKESNQLEKCGGVDYLVTLAQSAGTCAHIEEYCAIVREKSTARKQLELARRIENDVLNGEESSDISSAILDQLKTIESRSALRDPFSLQFLNQREKNFLLTDPPKKPMLLNYVDAIGRKTGFLPKGIVSMLVGAGGVGKTHLLAQLALAVASGQPWLDCMEPTEHCGSGKKGNVFLGLGENQYDDIHRLLHKASKRLRKQPMGEEMLAEASQRIAPFSFCGQQASFIQDRKPSRYFRQLKMRLEDMAPPSGWSLIILDPISRFLGADAETDNAAATQFIAMLEELTIELPGRPTVLFAHHVNKSAINSDRPNQTAARGSSALTDGVRWQVNFSKDNFLEEGKDLTTLRMTKSNFTRILEPITLKKDSDGFLERYDGASAEQGSNTTIKGSF